jgi:hypothetical protein
VLVRASVPLVAIWVALAAVLGIGFRRRVRKERPGAPRNETPEEPA